ncbi:FkbM family methyltransferase [Chelatococcus sp. GCM10030263]|uniref:FkbM family methyltransferase n=1 Tax=Chelatococcus sp. GCM10030263 TaxID=3273387 RepID=UPI00360FFBB0
MDQTARVVRLGGAAITVADDYPTFWQKADAGRWEPGTLAVMAAVLGPDTLFLDLGAWIGPTSLFAAACGARVIAVEADPAALTALRRNIAANPTLADRITVLERAVHAQAGTVSFGARRKPGDSMSSTLLAAEASVTWSAETVTPAELAAMVKPRERPVIKMDIEGGEYQLLPVLAPLVARPAAMVVVSFHPQIVSEARPQDSLAALSRAALAPFAGWQARRIGDAGAGEPQNTRELTAGTAYPDGEWLLTRT